ncbi:hypothetical protein AVDCRST_MAG81-3776 [uncultured Synechococcales cyanobacterium]|uniref:Uncharacterized protein n=1 Tax=uncultured Synechococcales cyanobacterium TaxID=1936017 RepID=A0A6J4VT08_9CYAN|nr:hypothetical protein AVDCRST_MAG81-3776 [uncultured Synechococcales cyanobacterium]
MRYDQAMRRGQCSLLQNVTFSRTSPFDISGLAPSSFLVPLVAVPSAGKKPRELNNVRDESTQSA